jgi:leader peptidase (prepilin peptidase)/N-methyltransferase
MFGASLGSFLCLVATRMDPTKAKKGFSEVFLKPSHCDSTGKQLTPIEMVPVFSWLFLKGRSRNDTKKKLPVSYLIMEIVCGTLAILIAWLYLDNPLQLIVYGIVIYSFVYLAYFDFLYWEVQLGLIIFNFFLFSFYYFFQQYNGEIDINYIVQKYTACILGILFIVVFIVISKGKGLGLGDAWIMGIMGLSLGYFELFIALTIASVTGSLFGLIKAYLFVGKVRGVMIQFVPFLSLGFIITLMFGKEIIQYVYY